MAPKAKVAAEMKELERKLTLAMKAQAEAEKARLAAEKRVQKWKEQAASGRRDGKISKDGKPRSRSAAALGGLGDLAAALEGKGRGSAGSAGGSAPPGAPAGTAKQQKSAPSGAMKRAALKLKEATLSNKCDSGPQ